MAGARHDRLRLPEPREPALRRAGRPAGDRPPLPAACARERASFDDLLYRAKKLILRTAMSSELYVLARHLDRLSEQHRWSRDFTQSSLHLAWAR